MFPLQYYERGGPPCCFAKPPRSKYTNNCLVVIYAFVSSLYPREYVKTSFKMHHIEGSFKRISRWPSTEHRIMLSVLTQPTLSIHLSCYPGKTLAIHIRNFNKSYAPTLHQGMTKKCIGDSAFGAAAPRLWNELPVNIRASGTLPMFRKCLKTYLFIRHFN